jgi:hypothetical protein
VADEGGYSLKEMVTQLRNWRHDKAIPQLAAHEARLVVLEAEMREITEGLIPKMDRLVTKLDRNEAVATDIRKRAEQGFTRKQKVIGVLIAILALGLQATSVLIALTQ